MNTGLWIVQIALCIKFIAAAINHGIRHNMEEMEDAIAKMGGNVKLLLRIIAVIMTLCALGLILPGVFHVLPRITIVSAGLLALLSLLSIILHVYSRDNPKIFASVILIVLTSLVAYGRMVI